MQSKDNLKIYSQQIKFLHKSLQGDSGASHSNTNDPFKSYNQKPLRDDFWYEDPKTGENYEALCRGDFENILNKVI